MKDKGASCKMEVEVDRKETKMEPLKVTNKSLIAPLFQGWQETMIWSCLQDCMGVAYADDLIAPSSAMILVADFCFFAGEPSRMLVANKPVEHQSNFIIMVPATEEWGTLIEETYGTGALRRERYAIKKESNAFNREKLEQIVQQLQSPYELKLINHQLYDQILQIDWTRDLCSQFYSYEDYQNHGLGVVARKDGQIVSGASSYTYYKQGIEIEIDTKKEERRKGLALACGAKLILECLNRGLYPSWDAYNKASVALAEKLGYHYDKEYPVYEVRNY